MSLADTINFFEALVQRLQHGGLLADQANDIAIRMTPHVDALKDAQNQGANIIDVTPTQKTQSQTPVPYRPPAPPQDWNTPAQPQNRQPSQVPEAPEGFRWGQVPTSEGH